MLQLLLAPDDGGTAWRHLLAAGAARAGWDCVGPHRLAARAAQLAGVPSRTAPAPDRLAAYAARLDADEDGARSYSASREHDPFGVAGFLLGLRDRLLLAGWRGGPLEGSARLVDLARLEARPEPLPAGLPDLLRALVAELRAPGARGRAAGLELQLAAPREAFAPLVLALVEALAGAGAKVVEPPAAGPAHAATDLSRLQRALLDPSAARAALRGDGTVLFLEADTPLEAAELCADLLRARPVADTTLLPAAEPEVLEAALLRQGLPTVGLRTPSALRPHLQVLPLRLALAFAPQEPFRAAELLLLPGGPLPGRVRARLLEALASMPGVWSPAWREAVSACVAGEGAALEQRIEAWFGGALADPSEGIPAARAAAIAGEVAGWLATRAAADGEPDEESTLWAHAASVARTLERTLLARPADERLRPMALSLLHELAVGDGAERAPWPPKAGRPALAPRAASLLDGAARVVWWGFVQDVETQPGPDPWSAAERAGLAAAGVRLPAPGAVRAVEAWIWRRAVSAAREAVVFVRWRLGGTEVLQPHPFADELETRVARGSLAACTATSEAVLAGRGPWRPRTVAVAPCRPVRPRTVWRTPALAVAGTQSATQLKTLLGCPFTWALRYPGGLRPGRALELPTGDTLLGDFAHRLLQALVAGPDRPGEDVDEVTARAWVERAFDARVATEAAELVLRGHELELEHARGLVGAAAAALVRHLRAGDWAVVGVEAPLAGELRGHPTGGRADLVVARRRDGARAVIDLKLSGFVYRRKELERGRGLQLALYASMLGGDAGHLPPAAYLILDGGELLTVEPRAFPGAVVAEGPALAATLRSAGEALDRWEDALARGYLPAAIEGSTWEDDVAPVVGELPDANDPSRYEPECGFCAFTALCRVEVGAEAGEAAP